ncbi:MAG: transglutaminase domain-containing protein [Halobacteriales archaeon]
MGAIALAGGLVLTGTYAAVLHDVTSVVGGTPLLALLSGSLVVATLLALAVRPRVALLIGTGLLGLGAVGYLEAAPLGWRLLGDLGKVASDTAVLLSGTSVLRMQAAGAWALSFAPGPVVLSWYLFVRGRYAPGVGVGGLALLAFVLTGDAGPVLTLVGVVAGAVAVGAGELSVRDRSLADADALALVLAAMVVVTTTVSVVPATGTGDRVLPIGPDPTVEAGLVGTGDRMDVVGSVSLSPEVRFVVETDRSTGSYWRVGAFDRYTGQGWVRTGSAKSYDEDDLGGWRAGEGTAVGVPMQEVVQRVSVRTKTTAIPAAWRPVELDGDAEDVAELSSLGGLQARSALSPGDEYTVVSRQPVAGEEALRSVGDDYPDAIEDRYTQLPADTPDRLDDFTDRVTEGADGPYEVASRIETWLESNKDYSLNVDRPDDHVASSFLFDMEAGYCTYFATAMVGMLRTQGVPARMVVGYTTGQRVDRDRWVVRGYNAHAWVEVFFPEVGWVRFDPTPAAERERAERNSLEDARDDGQDDVDAAGSSDGTWTPEPTPTPNTPDPTDTTTATTASGTPANRTPPGAGRASEVTPTGAIGPGDGPHGPDRALLAFGAVLLVGVVAGVRQTRAVNRLRRLVGTYYQRPSDDPDRDVKRAAERLERALAADHRDRAPWESRGVYLARLAALERDERLRTVGHLHEVAVYGGGVERERADEAIATVDAVIRERKPVVEPLLGA